MRGKPSQGVASPKFPVVDFGIVNSLLQHLANEMSGGKAMSTSSPSPSPQSPVPQPAPSLTPPNQPPFSLSTPTLSNDDFEWNTIRARALELSRIRKAQAILHKYGGDLNRYFDSIESTAQECEADWRNAIASIAINEFPAHSKLWALSSDCFHHFEGIFLEQLRQTVAYHRWLASTGDQHCEEIRVGCYFEGCNELRERLVAVKKMPGPMGAVQYLLDTYLNQRGEADQNKIVKLIKLKLQRLDGYVSNPFAFAKRFVSTFYDNAYVAITTGDKQAVTQVLQAVQNGGSEPGKPSIVNAYEALLLIMFLDGATVQEIWTDPNSGIVREATL